MLIGSAYIHGIGSTPVDYDKAYQYLASCEAEDPRCLAGIAYIYMNVPPGKSLFVPRNDNQGYDRLKKAINMKLSDSD